MPVLVYVLLACMPPVAGIRLSGLSEIVTDKADFRVAVLDSEGREIVFHWEAEVKGPGRLRGRELICTGDGEVVLTVKVMQFSDKATIKCRKKGH